MAKIMLVEDDNNLREIYEARLEAEGYDIVSASDGEEALVLAKSEKPDLVISDVMMPKISGFEMLDILRNTDGLKDVKVIMLTALGQAEDKSRADALGADQYLVKSQVTLEDIIKSTHHLLDDPTDEPAPVIPAAEAAAPAPAATTPAAPTTAAPATDTTPVATPAADATVPTATVPVVAAPDATPPAEPVVPATLPEPVAITPVATAEPAVTPEVAAESAPAEVTPETVAAGTDALSGVDTQTTAEEEAAMEAQIQSFIQPAAEAPGETPVVEPPAESEAEPTPEPSETSSTPEVPASVSEAPAAEPAADTTAEATTASHDQVMASAVDSLVADTTAQQKPSEVTAVEVAPPAPTAEAPAPATANPDGAPQTAETHEPVTAVAGTGADNSDAVTVAHKKVIAPINDPTKKTDLNQLLAKEEALVAITPPVATAVVNPQAAAAAPASTTTSIPVVEAPDSNDGLDPNVVAL
jgi:CheY-like chemotaxis protein